MKRYYYVVLCHKKDDEVKAIFVDAASLDYDDYCSFMEDFLAKKSICAKICSISRISSLQYLKNRHLSFRVALHCLPALLDMKKKAARKEAFKRFFCNILREA